jgi:hypothetical protein
MTCGARSRAAGALRVNDAPTCGGILHRPGTASAIFMISKPRHGLFAASESPLSDKAACCCQHGDGHGCAVR